MKAIGLFLVIAGHTSFDHSETRFIYSFHMPLFFVISGIIAEKINGSKPSRSFVKILRAYLIFFLISYFYYIGNPLNEKATDFFKRLFYIRRMGPNIALWYLPLYALVLCCFSFIYKKKYLLYLSLPIMVAITPIFQEIFQDECILMLGVLPAGIAFVVSGYLVSKFIKNNFYIAFLCFFIGIALLSIDPGGHIAAIRSPLYFVRAWLFIYPIYCISQIIHSSMLEWFGKNSLTIFSIHLIVISILSHYNINNLPILGSGIMQHIYWVMIIAFVCVIFTFCSQKIIYLLKKISKNLLKQIVNNKRIKATDFRAQ